MKLKKKYSTLSSGKREEGQTELQTNFVVRFMRILTPKQISPRRKFICVPHK